MNTTVVDRLPGRLQLTIGILIGGRVVVAIVVGEVGEAGYHSCFVIWVNC